jgi:hypothetical protein
MKPKVPKSIRERVIKQWLQDTFMEQLPNMLADKYITA